MWIFNFLVTQFFPVLNEIPFLQQAFHGAFSFWIFAAINLFCLLFLLRYVPETRGVALDDIEKLLADRIKLNKTSHSSAVSSASTENLGGKHD